MQFPGDRNYQPTYPPTYPPDANNINLFNKSGNNNNEEIIEFTPSCSEIVFMLPFPFFCMGCSSCMSMTSKLIFNNMSQILTLQTNPGYCFCCRTTFKIPYENIMKS